MKKMLALILALLTVATAAACSSGESGDSVTTASSDTTAAVTEADDPYAARYAVKEELPEVDYEGYTFTYYLRSEKGNNIDFAISEESGDIVEDEVYKRNLKVAERFNINFAFNYDESGNTTYTTTAVQSIMANEDVNDLLGLHGAFVFNHAKQGYLLDWRNDLTYCDLEKPWWDSDFSQNLAIAGKLFGMTGDISHLSIASTFCLVFNKNLMTSYNLEFPYQSVRDGTWTFDKLSELCKTVSEDINGDGSMTPDADNYGIYTGSWNYPISMFYMAGDRVITINGEGKPVLSVYTDRTVDIIEKFVSLCNTANIYVTDYSPAYNGDIFNDGRALFSGASLDSLQSLRSLDIDLGVVPCPKYNDNTVEYYSLVDAGQNVFSVPVTASDPERTSVIIEALAAEGYRKIVPTFFEEALKVKYSRDNESADMLETIRDGRFFDYGYFDATISWDLSYIGRNVLLNGGDFTSYYNQRESGAQANIELLYEQYSK